MAVIAYLDRHVGLRWFATEVLGLGARSRLPPRRARSTSGAAPAAP